jgi:AbrB family looped-hinge helix DNA binding protein
MFALIMEFGMELAKVTSQGQITIPLDIRKYLNIKSGDKVVLMEDEGRVIMANSSMLALKEAQSDFAGVAESMGLKDDLDVVELVKDLRKRK